MKKIAVLLSFLSFSAIASNQLEIIKIGHPVLRAQAQELHQGDIRDEKFQKLIDDMIFTMGKAGGVGLAAPQVNQSLRLFVMKSWPAVPLTVIINPTVEYLEESGKKDSVEGCLSIPGKSLKVKRYKKIRISYFNRHGDYKIEEFSGFKAIIAQHEYDHLNGVMIVDLIQELNGSINYYGFSEAPLM